MIKAVITGATGLIGSAMAKLLCDKGIEVFAVVRPNGKRLNNLCRTENLHIVECDINELAKVPQLIKVQCDWFFHFAWQGVFGAERNDVVLQAGNVANTLEAIRVAKALGCIRFIGAGSQAEYGIVNEKLTPNTSTHPSMEYGKAKLEAFRQGARLAREIGIDFLWGRILSAYGIGDNDNTMVGSILRKMLNGESCDLSSGTQIWDYMFASDVANAFYHIAEKGVVAKPYPIGSGEARPLKDYIEDMYRIVGNDKAKLNFGVYEVGALTYLSADIAELTKDTGFVTMVTFEEGIKKTVEHLRGQNG